MGLGQFPAHGHGPGAQQFRGLGQALAQTVLALEKDERARGAGKGRERGAAARGITGQKAQKGIGQGRDARGGKGRHRCRRAGHGRDGQALGPAGAHQTVTRVGQQGRARIRD